jgi:hypothetical protein
MKRLIRLAAAFSVASTFLASSAVPGTLSKSTLASLAKGSQTDVIVIMRDQLPGMAPVRGMREARTAALDASRAPVIAELRQAGAGNVRTFKMINAVAARVSREEAQRLASHPLVAAVVADRVIQMKPRVREAVAASSPTGTPPDTSGLCNTLEPEALQLTKTAFLDPAVPQARDVHDANGKPVIGEGVKVAYLADGLDPKLPGFTRPDGSSVFIDYQDFSGDPAGTPTAGGEAFGDASSIAAQTHPNGKPLYFDLSKFVNVAYPLPSPCNIMIRGMAPGASLVGLKVFSSLGYTTTSSFIQAIEYAVLTDDVDVINESFGGNPYPDNANDPTSLANDAAVDAGVTVVVSTGDAGSMGTIGSPSTDTKVIAAGATTQYRLYRQLSYYLGPLTNGTGYVDNNISAFSSGGFAQTGARTVDVVAPGESGWALCSTNVSLFADCTDANAKPAPIEDFGGTSESAPLISGEAALVIQAYRSTHGGTSPTPAMVKRIIMSTATDINAPSSEQGAGLIDSLAAVRAALSADSPSTRPSWSVGLLNSPSAAAVEAEPGTEQALTFTITNVGTKDEHLQPALQTLDKPFAQGTLNLNLDPLHDTVVLNAFGAKRAYITQTFEVPQHADHLDVALAYQNPPSTSNYVYLALLDPKGRQTSYSVPQGAGTGYAHVDVVKPLGGKWTAIIFTRVSGAAGSYAGPVQMMWAAERFATFGSVWPASFDLAAGQSQKVTAKFTMPSQSGDVAAALRFASAHESSAGSAEIPLSLRTLIPTGRTGGTFTGTVTGGNGRAGAGPTQTFAFNVPQGVHDLSVHLELSDNGYQLEGLLIDPNGMQLSVDANMDPSGAPQYGIDLYHFDPQPGQWRFVLALNSASGNQTSEPFTGRVAYNSAHVSAPGLPNDPSVTWSAAAGAVTIPVTVTNTGSVAQAYFVDGRLGAVQGIEFPTQVICSTPTLPGTCAAFILPTEVSSVLFAAQASAPITMDAYNDVLVGNNIGVTGSPDIYAKQVGNGFVVATLSKPEIPYGAWVITPALVGPFGPSGAPTVPVSTGAFAVYQPFDPALSSSSGDIWEDLILGTNTYKPLVLGPGDSGTIMVTVTPNVAQVGETVSGYLYIDTFSTALFTGDEVVRIPYAYTISK